MPSAARRYPIATRSASSDVPLRRSLMRIPSETGLIARLGRGRPSWVRTDRLGDDASYGVLRAAAASQTRSDDDELLGRMAMWRVGGAAAVATLLFGLDRRVPRLDPATTWFKPYSEDEPTRVVLEDARFACLVHDAAVDASDAEPVEDLRALTNRLAAELERFMTPAVSAIHERTGIARTELWGLGSVEAQVALGRLFADRGDVKRGVAEVRAVQRCSRELRAMAPRFGTIEVRGKLHLDLAFRVCCGASRWAEPVRETCAVCPQRSPADRRRQQRARLSVPLLAVHIAPAEVREGTAATLTIDLGTAEHSGVLVTVGTDGEGVVQAPPSILVPPRTSSASAEVRVLRSRVPLRRLAVISASAGGVTRSATVSVTPRTVRVGGARIRS